ncbi:histidinol-phosphate transaminase [Paenibacillus flagellatus]|uniref:Histidinol-phosphate aminotransferase n=1 Tax=Paenibacillus flagellatus TaxID=2211139 RepID=A0A2V5JXR3_9BACL|nr:histidinol-phosphate transaminase [Paenibacillus flagellatus]PYI51598.1 histidinol-phosphate transaminase [Paenibacillus flagellatus]
MIAIHPLVEKLEPYSAGIRPEPGVPAIKLNQNENPYPASPKVAEALRRLAPELVAAYPEALSDRLRESLSATLGVPASRILCGNGSSELITLMYRTFAQEGDTAAMPDPTFALYGTVADLAGVRVRRVPTDDRFRFEPAELAASGDDTPRLVVFANPNAPTGTCAGRDAIEKLLRTFDGLVVVDEAYVDFAPEGTSVVDLTGTYEHLLVLRTFSKAYALPGARVGYAVGSERLVRAMEKARETFSVNAVGQLAAEAALGDPDWMRRSVARIGRTRDAFCAALADAGWGVWPSTANFVLVSPPPGGASAPDMYRRLLDNRIYVRYFDAPRLRDKLRISIGTDDDMKAVLDVLLEGSR